MTATADAKSRWTRKIAKYNQDYVTSTDDYNKCNIVIYNMFSENWFDNLKKKVNYRLRADYKKYKATETKSIKNKINKRVLVNKKLGSSTKRLVTDLGEIKKAVDNDFASIFRKRNTLQNSLTSLWQQIYKPAG
uniref:Uncharacterized protein n=1 Tax=Rhizophagus irregularis (strain DAOM 181602 / DAOM 197198 / MUCL 43194) TaxID=747089 RepID=U9UV60_RHIID